MNRKRSDLSVTNGQQPQWDDRFSVAEPLAGVAMALSFLGFLVWGAGFSEVRLRSSDFRVPGKGLIRIVSTPSPERGLLLSVYLRLVRREGKDGEHENYSTRGPRENIRCPE